MRLSTVAACHYGPVLSVTRASILVSSHRADSCENDIGIQAIQMTMMDCLWTGVADMYEGIILFCGFSNVWISFLMCNYIGCYINVVEIALVGQSNMANTSEQAWRAVVNTGRLTCKPRTAPVMVSVEGWESGMDAWSDRAHRHMLQ